MGDEQSLLAYGRRGRSTNTRNSIAATLFPPLTPLNSGDHQFFIGDGGEPQLDCFDDPPLGECNVLNSKPFMVLDVISNLAFVLVSMFALLTTIREKPSTPLRVWIGGYGLQCLLHVGSVYLEYQRRNLTDLGIEDSLLLSQSHNSIIKRLQSIKAVISSVWWVFGFYWIIVGGQAHLQDSPRLYWLAVGFLAFEVFFSIFCIAVASIVFFALFCCFPIVATIAYGMTIGERASENDIKSLPKFKYCQANPFGTFDNHKKQDVNGLAAESGNSYSASELALQLEDSECCICLHRYVEGAELCSLPCNHHFHFGCITKWLRINATCPLCKFNILKPKAEMLV